MLIFYKVTVPLRYVLNDIYVLCMYSSSLYVKGTAPFSI